MLTQWRQWSFIKEMVLNHVMYDVSTSYVFELLPVNAQENFRNLSAVPLSQVRVCFTR